MSFSLEEMNLSLEEKDTDSVCDCTTMDYRRDAGLKTIELMSKRVGSRSINSIDEKIFF